MSRPLPSRAERQASRAKPAGMRVHREEPPRIALRRRPLAVPLASELPDVDSPRGLGAAAPHLVLLAVIVNVAACLLVAQLTGGSPVPRGPGRSPDLVASRDEPDRRSIAAAVSRPGLPTVDNRLSLFRWAGQPGR